MAPKIMRQVLLIKGEKELCAPICQLMHVSKFDYIEQHTAQQSYF